mmetsp:Transcript_77811/g.202734  ORF Transcript_77811/g.202734 Transcript_77811/m.202734 type:complete len:204 (-) Transcript_77811:664-1275(-)
MPGCMPSGSCSFRIASSSRTSASTRPCGWRAACASSLQTKVCAAAVGKWSEVSPRILSSSASSSRSGLSSPACVAAAPDMGCWISGLLGEAEDRTLKFREADRRGDSVAPFAVISWKEGLPVSSCGGSRAKKPCSMHLRAMGRTRGLSTNMSVTIWSASVEERGRTRSTPTALTSGTRKRIASVSFVNSGQSWSGWPSTWKIL